jgi:hypothetical protein
VPGTRETFNIVVRSGVRYEAAQVSFAPDLLNFLDHKSGQWLQLSIGEVGSIGTDYNCDETGDAP